MNLLRALKGKLLLLYILTFVMGIVFYTTTLFIRSTEQTEFIPVLKAYFLSFYVFIFGYIVLKAYKAIQADEEEKVKDDTAIVNDTEIVSFAEVRELTRYAAAHGIDKEVSSLPEGSLEKNKATILCQLTVLLNHGETVLNFLTLALQFNFSRINRHSQVVEYPPYITRQLFDGGCNTVFTNGFNQPSGKSA